MANEFAEVTVAVVRSGNGSRLELRSPRWQTSVRLDAVELEALTWQQSEVFSRMLEGSVPAGAIEGT